MKSQIILILALFISNCTIAAPTIREQNDEMMKDFSAEDKVLLEEYAKSKGANLDEVLLNIIVQQAEPTVQYVDVGYIVAEQDGAPDRQHGEIVEIYTDYRQTEYIIVRWEDGTELIYTNGNGLYIVGKGK